MFTQIFSDYLQTHNISAYSVAKKTGISQGLMNEYKNGIKLPTIQNLLKIADYLDCSVDYLLGRKVEVTPAPMLTESEQLLVDYFRSTDEIGRMKIIQYVLNEQDRTEIKLAAEQKKSVPPIVSDEPRHT